jgi:hypothetical protein
VTIDKMGIVDVKGYFYCQNMPDGTWVHQDGQVVQSIGRKTLVAGGVSADYQLGSRVWGCWDPNDQNACGEMWIGGTEAYVKVVKK